MRYIGLLTDADQAVELPASKELLESMGKLMDRATRSNFLVRDDDCQPSPFGARVKLSGGQVTVTRRVLNEAKGPATPCAVFDVDSLLEAIQWTTCLLQVLGEGECEIRPMC